MRFGNGLIGFAALLMAGLPSIAEAATLYITEFNSPISQDRSQTAQNLGQPAIASQTVAIGGASVQSAAFNAQTHGIQVYCDEGCSVLVGSNPTATTSNQVLTAQQPMIFTVAPSQKIAVIANSSGDPGGGGVAANVNVASWGGTATTLGQKTMAASVPITWASDQSALPAGSNVIGHVIVDTGSTTAVTGNVTVVQPTGTNLHAVLDAGTSLIGKVGIDQTTPGTTNGVVSTGYAFTNALTITRPANATPYTAGDVVGGALTFTNMGSNGGQIILTGDQLELDVSAVPTGMSYFTLYLYNVTPPSAIADNSPWDLPAGDRASYLGYVNMGLPIDLGSTVYVEINGINKQLKLAGTSLFGYLVTAGGYTPAGNSEVYVDTLHAVAVGN